MIILIHSTQGLTSSNRLLRNLRCRPYGSAISTSKFQFRLVTDTFWRPFVKQFGLCYQTVVCPVCPVCSVCLSVCLTVCLSVCLSVTVVYCGQTVGWIKMKLGMQVGLGPGHIVLDGDPAPLPKGAQPPSIFS